MYYRCANCVSYSLGRCFNKRVCDSISERGDTEVMSQFNMVENTIEEMNCNSDIPSTLAEELVSALLKAFLDEVDQSDFKSQKAYKSMVSRLNEMDVDFQEIVMHGDGGFGQYEGHLIDVSKNGTMHSRLEKKHAARHIFVDEDFWCKEYM